MNSEIELDETELTCSRCGRHTFLGSYDEDESVWCPTCIRRWEVLYKEDWATGAPMKGYERKVAR